MGLSGFIPDTEFDSRYEFRSPMKVFTVNLLESIVFTVNLLESLVDSLVFVAQAQNKLDTSACSPPRPTMMKKVLISLSTVKISFPYTAAVET